MTVAQDRMKIAQSAAAFTHTGSDTMKPLFSTVAVRFPPKNTGITTSPFGRPPLTVGFSIDAFTSYEFPMGCSADPDGRYQFA